MKVITEQQNFTPLATEENPNPAVVTTYNVILKYKDGKNMESTYGFKTSQEAEDFIIAQGFNEITQESTITNLQETN